MVPFRNLFHSTPLFQFLPGKTPICNSCWIILLYFEHPSHIVQWKLSSDSMLLKFTSILREAYTIGIGGHSTTQPYIRYFRNECFRTPGKIYLE